MEKTPGTKVSRVDRVNLVNSRELKFRPIPKTWFGKSCKVKDYFEWRDPETSSGRRL